MLPLGTQLFFSLQIKNFLKIQIIIVIIAKTNRKKCTQEHLRNALKSLLLQKKDAVKFPVQNNSSTPLAKKAEKNIKRKKITNKHITYLS